MTRHPAYDRRLAEQVRRWLDSGTGQELHLAYDGDHVRTLHRQKAAITHHSGHRYWWWVAVDDLGRHVSSGWHWMPPLWTPPNC